MVVNAFFKTILKRFYKVFQLSTKVIFYFGDKALVFVAFPEALN